MASTAFPAVTSASFSFTVTVRGLTASAVTVTGSGQADFADDALSAQVVLPGNVAGLLPGGSSSPETVDAVVSGDVLYLDVPGLAGLTGTPWISLSLPSRTVAGAFNTIASALGDVSGIVSFAASRGATVTSLGSSTVDGTAVTGEAVSVGSRAWSLDATLWGNASNQLVRGVLDVAGKTGSPSLSATVDLSGYDAPVTITVPPSSQVRAIPLFLVQQALTGAITNSKPLHKLVRFTHAHLVRRGRGRRHHAHHGYRRLGSAA